MVALMLCAALAFPQGAGAAGGGQGGGFGGGGFGGGAGSQMGNMPGEEETFKHILTPGDKTEWPIKAKAGEVLILRASSDSFDPAIEVADEKDQKIAENDDEEPGKQNALLLVYFDKAGTYKAHVKNYRSTAGGQYEFGVRRFVSQTISLDHPAVVLRQDAPVYARVVAPKGQIVVLGNSSYPIFEELIAPSGKPADWLPTVSGPMQRAFRVEEDGAYYARTRVRGRPDDKGTLSVHVASARRAELGKPLSSTVDLESLDVWTVAAKAGDFMRVSVGANEAAELGIGRVAPTPAGQAQEEPLQLVDRGRKWQDSAAVLFNKAGEYEFYVRSRRGSMPYTLELNQAWIPWLGSGTVVADLPIGSTAFYGFDAKPGYLARYEVQAKNFDVFVQLFDGKWHSPAFFDDSTWRNTNAAGTVFLRDGGRYYVAVSCVGGGGGGEYRLQATTVEPKHLKVGERIEAVLNSPLDGLWSVPLEESSTYSIRLKGRGAVTVTNPEGQTVSSRSVMVADGDYMYLFDTSAGGEYRIWIQPLGEDRAFKLLLQPIGD